LAASVEKETCVSLKSKFCWNPHAELKTKIEYGFGLGMSTIAYNADGTVRFNVFEEEKKLDPSLGNWAWADRFDATKQLTAFVLKDKQGYDAIALSATPYDHVAFSKAAYNGGGGGLSSDRRLCQATPHCNPNIWFGNVELTSLKSRSAKKGYGQSAYDINRGYVREIVIIRRPKYDQYFQEK